MPPLSNCRRIKPQKAMIQIKVYGVVIKRQKKGGRAMIVGVPYNNKIERVAVWGRDSNRYSWGEGCPVVVTGWLALKKTPEGPQNWGTSYETGTEDPPVLFGVNWARIRTAKDFKERNMCGYDEKIMTGAPTSRGWIDFVKQSFAGIYDL